MPIRMVLKNFRTAPIVFCDHCDRPIEKATDGNYEWEREDAEGTGNNPQGVEVRFTHKWCSDAFTQAHPDLTLVSMELLVFPLFLANNLEVDTRQAVGVATGLAGLSPRDEDDDNESDD